MAFPTSPYLNQVYWRDDLDLLCYYDGTRWLTVDEKELAFVGSAAQPISVSGTDLGYAPTSAYDKYIIACRFNYYVVSTNNGSNYWTVAVLNSSTGATVGSVNSSAVSAGAWITASATVGSVVNAVTQIRVTKTGSPGNIYCTGALRYRLVVT